MAQVLPALLGGLFWRGATRAGAAAGLLTGFVVWAYTLFLPSFGAGAVRSARVDGRRPLGHRLAAPAGALRHRGAGPADPRPLLVDDCSTPWPSCAVSLLTFPTPMERLQGAQIRQRLRPHAAARAAGRRGSAEAEDLLVMAQRILGAAEAQALFQREAAAQGKAGYLPDTTPEFLDRLERRAFGLGRRGDGARDGGPDRRRPRRSRSRT